MGEGKEGKEGMDLFQIVHILCLAFDSPGPSGRKKKKKGKRKKKKKGRRFLSNHSSVFQWRCGSPFSFAA